MPHGWDEWANQLFNLIQVNTESETIAVTFYVGEVEYATELEKRFPTDDGNSYHVEIADRQDIKITSLR